MFSVNPLTEHRRVTKELARSLKKTDVYHWLCENGYFPESYVLPPCFKVVKRPIKPKLYYKIKSKGKQYKVDRTECINVHFPKTEYTDRNFGLINPFIHNDIAYHIARNWLFLVEAMIPNDSQVASYAFPVPIDSRNQGRIGYLRSGRLIYEFIGMVDKDITSIAYKYSHIVKADIKSFYPSLYTHSISWAIHGKKFIRQPTNLHNFNLLGNLLDKLFQNANDGCTNGIPIGPVVSDIIAEIVASAIDVKFTKGIKEAGIICEAVRFKDDYRILAKSESDAKRIIKILQFSLKEYNLELSDEKTSISILPDGLFREWVSRYHAVHPKKRRRYSWKEFQELYLSVIQIDRLCPGTGVIDRFLADIVSKKGNLKVGISEYNLEKVISMLLMLGTLRIKSFPKIMAILESVLQSSFGITHQEKIVEYLEQYLSTLSNEEERNKYLISWISYFLVSNNLHKLLSFKPAYKDPITKSIFNNRGNIFNHCSEHKFFIGCRTIAKKVTMLEYLDVFNPPKIT
ncbi:Reverse transcriptase (RNA-dependent DNA polymerase) [Nitrosomonas ureae]|uniref:Reverse transcriptase (RNA-dependent DNA polymerase) n=1 Tax=Nitrosomonas ureae TaxID=44577 RepID=A0A285C2F6_9PROT|nr:RNA-directed DNA polymerase [Nitrosomonas ureae]SNX61326.1 Reverse transcriptase (RNA-dependent DNA polymerase) [Nitrosomonas ureae]